MSTFLHMSIVTSANSSTNILHDITYQSSVRGGALYSDLKTCPKQVLFVKQTELGQTNLPQVSKNDIVVGFAKARIKRNGQEVK